MFTTGVDFYLLKSYIFVDCNTKVVSKIIDWLYSLNVAQQWYVIVLLILITVTAPLIFVKCHDITGAISVGLACTIPIRKV